jgi:signal transduction histidine kinase
MLCTWSVRAAIRWLQTLLRGRILIAVFIWSDLIESMRESSRMASRKLRFSVTRKIALGLALIIAIGVVSMMFIYRGLGEIEHALHRLAAVEAPLNAAAYELELNVNGAGLAVLKYLATRRPEYRAWAQDDEEDFAHYHGAYLQLVRTDHERGLGNQVGALHAQFQQLGQTLMSHADRQERLYAAITEYTEEIDYIIDARLQPSLSGRAARSERMGPAIASADLEAETAEVGLWVANYHREPSARAKQTITRKLEGLERSLANLRSFDLTEQEARQARALRAAVARITTAVKQVIELEDAIHAGREQFIALRESIDTLLDDEMQVLALRGLDTPREEAEVAAADVQHAMRYLAPSYLLTAGVIGFLLVRVIRRPLAELNRGTQAVAAGDMTHRVQAHSNDEFGDLANQYNLMVEQLRTTTVSRDRLEESEQRLRGTVTELRREIEERERAERERERLQAELRRSETMSAMGALVAGVAHEVRNPLFAISSTLDAMVARFGEQTDYRRYLDVLRMEIGRLGKLMADLLSYGKPPTHEFAVGTLDAAITPAIDSCSAHAREANVALVNRVQIDGPLRLNASRLQQAFQNVIANALQHAPSGSEVSIETSVANENERRWLECTIKDSGPGFSGEALHKVFEPFFTLRRGGTGLGLALVQRIVHEHGGEVFAENRPEGGACVRMRLPLVEG